MLEPGPWMTRNQNAKTAPQTTAVVAEDARRGRRSRWSWPAARRTRIHALSSRFSSDERAEEQAEERREGDEDAEADAAREVVAIRN